MLRRVVPPGLGLKWGDTVSYARDVTSLARAVRWKWPTMLVLRPHSGRERQHLPLPNVPSTYVGMGPGHHGFLPIGHVTATALRDPKLPFGAWA